MPFTIMPLEIDVIENQEEEKYPLLPVDDDLSEFLAERVSGRCDLKRKLDMTKGQLDVFDGDIREIVNEAVFECSPDELPDGYHVHGVTEGSKVDIQVKNSYRPIASSIKKKKGEKEKKETAPKILQLAEILGLREVERDDDGNITEIVNDTQENGVYNWPEGTFVYRDTIVVDPSVVEPGMMPEFIADMNAVGKKYGKKNDKGQVVLSPVKQKTELWVVTTFHRARQALGAKVNKLIAQVFQNLSITMPKEK